MSTEEYVYGHVLDALSGGLYPNKLDIIREYLQNSYDAISEYIGGAHGQSEKNKRQAESKVVITIKGGSLFIYDNATGMDFETLNEYRKIGFSRRPYGKYAGWRGIGKAAGLAVAEKLIVTTCKGKGDTYQLTFDASDMIKNVHELRAKGDNISFNELIEKHSRIKTIEGGDTPSTIVELCKIKADASELLIKNKLIAHLSMIAPVPFRPDFKYSKEIEGQLESALEEYMPINLYVENEKIYKPYIEKWLEIEGKDETGVDDPQFLPIYDEEKESLIAFCWYCMHSEKGQIKTNVKMAGEPVSVGGPVYRLHDIKIGDAYLTRRTLWSTTPERSLWAIGEVHIIDDRVEPTSDRNDFIDNHTRYMLYQQCRELAKEISRRAGKLSEETKAKEKIIEADSRIRDISAEVASKKVPKPVVPAYIYEATALQMEAEKRKPKTPEDELKEMADSVIKTASEVIKQLTDSLEISNNEVKVHYDITEDLDLSEEGKIIYNAILGILRDYYANEPNTFEDIVRKIEKTIEDALSS